MAEMDKLPANEQGCIWSMVFGATILSGLIGLTFGNVFGERRERKKVQAEAIEAGVAEYVVNVGKLEFKWKTK